MTSPSAVKAYFNYAGLNWPTPEVSAACREADERFHPLLFSLAGIDEYGAQMIRTRASIAHLMRLETDASDRIFFIPNATAGLSLLLQDLLTQLGPDRVALTSDQEHPAVERVLARTEGAGVRVERIRAASEDGFIEQLAARCAGGKLWLAVLSQVSYKDGRVLPIPRVAELLARARVPLIVDGNQAVGQVSIELPARSYAAYVFSGHKWLCAPMGTGAVVLDPEFWRIRSGSALGILNDLQNGTLSYVGLAGLEAACDLAARTLPERMTRLEQIQSSVAAALRDLPIVARPAWDGPMAPGITSLLMPDERPSQALAERLLTRHGVAVKAFVAPERPNAIRISWATSTTAAEIDLLGKALRAELG